MVFSFLYFKYIDEVNIKSSFFKTITWSNISAICIIEKGFEYGSSSTFVQS